MGKNNRIRIILCAIFILLLSTSIVYAASGSASVTSSLTVGQTGSIKLSANAPGGGFSGSVSVSDSSIIKLSETQVWADTGSSQTANPSQTISFTALKAGKTNVTVSFQGESLAGERFSYSNTFSVTVAEKPAPPPEKKPDPKPNPKPKTPVVDNTEKEKKEPKVPEKTPEEIEREKLEERMKTPLIKEISIISNSERLKGTKLATIEPESEVFEYSSELPRNINEVKLEIKTNQPNVELTYDEVVSIDEGKDSIELIIKAVQDKLEQEFTIVLKKPEETKFIFERDGNQLKLIVDPYLDKSMEGLGFEKVFINAEDPSLGFYYTYNKQNFVILADADNNAFVYLLDKDKKPSREVFLVTNDNKEVSFLVNEVLGEDDGRLLNENGYAEHEVEISKVLTDLDPTIKFNNIVGGWIYDADSIITHGLTSDGGSELVYLDKLNNVKSAFVSFDREPEETIDKLTYVGFGLWIVTLIAFIAYVTSNLVKAKKAQEVNI